MANNTNAPPSSTSAPVAASPTSSPVATAFPAYAETPLDTAGAGAGFGGLMVGADAGYGLGGGSYDNALITNASGRIGEQKLQRDIQASNALMASQQQHRINDQNYSNQFTTSLLNHMNTNIVAAMASGVPEEQAVRNAFIAYTQNTRDKLSPDADGMVMTNLQTRANTLANKMIQAGNIDGANALLKDLGVSGGGIDPLRASAMQGNFEGVRTGLEEKYPALRGSYDPATHTYGYMGRRVPESIVLNALLDTRQPFITNLNSYAYGQDLTGTGIGGGQPAPEAPPVSPLITPIPNMNTASQPGSVGYDINLENIEQFNKRFGGATAFETVDGKGVRTTDPSLFNLTPGTTQQSRMEYDNRVESLATQDPYALIKTAYNLSNGDVSKTAEYINTTVAQLRGAVGDVQNKLTKIQPTPENMPTINMLKKQLNTYQTQMQNLSNGVGYLRTSLSPLTPMTQDYNYDNAAGTLALQRTGYKGSMTPDYIPIPGGMMPAPVYNPEQIPTLTAKQNILNNITNISSSMSQVKSLWGSKDPIAGNTRASELIKSQVAPMVIQGGLSDYDIDSLMRQSNMTKGQALMFTRQLSGAIKNQAESIEDKGKRKSAEELADKMYKLPQTFRW